MSYIPTLVFPECERNYFLPDIGNEGNDIFVVTGFFLDTPPEGTTLSEQQQYQLTDCYCSRLLTYAFQLTDFIVCCSQSQRDAIFVRSSVPISESVSKLGLWTVDILS